MLCVCTELGSVLRQAAPSASTCAQLLTTAGAQVSQDPASGSAVAWAHSQLLNSESLNSGIPEVARNGSSSATSITSFLPAAAESSPQEKPSSAAGSAGPSSDESDLPLQPPGVAEVAQVHLQLCPRSWADID